MAAALESLSWSEDPLPQRRVKLSAKYRELLAKNRELSAKKDELSAKKDELIRRLMEGTVSGATLMAEEQSKVEEEKVILIERQKDLIKEREGLIEEEKGLDEEDKVLNCFQNCADSVKYSDIGDILHLLDSINIRNALKRIDACKMTAEDFTRVLTCNTSFYWDEWQRRYRRCSAEDAEFYQRIKNFLEDKNGIKFTSSLPTESSGIPRCSALIEGPIQMLMGVLGISLDQQRDSVQPQTTGNSRRPDVCIKLGSVIVFIAEEKRSKHRKKDAEDQLQSTRLVEQKFPILAMTRLGSSFQFFCKDMNSELKSVPSEIDSTEMRGRVLIFNYIINFCIFIQDVLIPRMIEMNSPRSSSMSGIPFPSIGRSNGLIEIYDLSVIKTTSERPNFRFDVVREIYEKIRQNNSPENDFLIKVISVARDGDELKVEMERLECPGIPLSASEFIQAAVSVSKCLRFLHNNGWVHTDIHWQNVRSTRRSGSPRFVLMDFEYARENGDATESHYLNTWEILGNRPVNFHAVHDVMLFRSMLMFQLHCLPFQVMRIFLGFTDGLEPLTCLQNCDNLDAIDALLTRAGRALEARRTQLESSMDEG